LSISSFFDHMYNTSHQQGCCDDRLNPPIRQRGVKVA